MFNGSRFNLTRYNLRYGQEDEIKLTGELTVAVRALAGSGENIYETLLGPEGIGGASQGGAGELVARDYAAALAQAATLRFMTPCAAAALEEVHAAPELTGNVWLALDLAGSLAGTAYFGYEIPAAHGMEAALAASAGAAWDVHMPRAEAAAVMAATASSERCEVVTLVVNASIPPGGTLVLDSETYTATLGGANILDLVQGEWLLLDRDSRGLRLDLDRGSVQSLGSELTYTPRWL